MDQSTSSTELFGSIPLFRGLEEQELKAIDGGVREIVNAAADFAQHDPEPDASELYTDIYR